MFDNILDGEYYFKDYIAAISFLLFILIGVILNTIGAIFGCISSCKKPKPIKRRTDDSDVLLLDSEVNNADAGNLNPSALLYNEGRYDYLRTYYTNKSTFWSILGRFFSWLGWISYSLAFIWLSAYQHLPIYATALMVFFVLSIKLWREILKMCPIVYKNRRVVIRRVISLRPVFKYAKIFGVVFAANKILMVSLIIIIIFISVFFPLVTEGSCLCFYNQPLGVSIADGYINYSSKLLRKVTMQPVCASDQICHVYATLPQSGGTSTFVTIHTGDNANVIKVEYKVKTSESDYISAQVETFPINGIEKLGKRSLYTAYMNDLLPDTMYSILITYGKNLSMTKLYKTPSDGANKPLTVAVGGGIGNNRVADTMMDMLTQKSELDVLYLGGNLAHDNNIRSCYYTYDTFINRIERAYEKLGHMIPIILTPGDHDLGVNAQKPTSFPTGPDASLYQVYFPQHLSYNFENKIPGLDERLTYHYHVLGQNVFMTLDTGYLRSIEEQTHWVNETASFYNKLNKFAFYHNPVFTPCNSDYATQFLMLHRIAPLFDLYNFKSAFESRQRFAKKSLPLKNNIKSEEGIYYLGNGAFGAKPDSKCQNNEDNIQKNLFSEIKYDNVAWILVIDQKANIATYTGYSESGEDIIPSFTQILK